MYAYFCDEEADEELNFMHDNKTKKKSYKGKPYLPHWQKNKNKKKNNVGNSSRNNIPSGSNPPVPQKGQSGNNNVQNHNKPFQNQGYKQPAGMPNIHINIPPLQVFGSHNKSKGGKQRNWQNRDNKDENRKDPNPNQRSTSGKYANVQCYNCQQMGHYSRYCPNVAQ